MCGLSWSRMRVLVGLSSLYSGQVWFLAPGRVRPWIPLNSPALLKPAIMKLFWLQYLVSLCINHAVSLSPGPLGLEQEFVTVCYSPGLSTLVPFFSHKPLGFCLPCLTHFRTSERISEQARNSEPTSLWDPHMTTPPLGTWPPPL